MRRVLFAGDSITKGELGCSYIDLLIPQFPDYELVNLGQDGDTLSGIMNRTIAYLQKDSSWDLIVIAAGHNDIILPDFMQKTDIHRRIVDSLKKKGSVPAADVDEFISIYKKFIISVQEIVDAPIIITTLSCLNENLSAATNENRSVYNQAIREIAVEHKVEIADIAESFNSILQKSDCRDYFMSNLLESVLFDKHKSKTVKGLDRLSKKRSLHLTIDGIHLNSKGAEVYEKHFVSILTQL